MITLKKAMTLSINEIEELKLQILESVKKEELNSYIKDSINFDDEKHYGKIPILIKDNICVKNSEITCASNILKGFISPYNADVINKLNNFNMCAFGRANMDEFGMGSSTQNSCYGATKNPHDMSRVPGGSSGGSAAAVAAKLAIASLGSDTGGSIRQPASFCGIVGLKPSYGRVSRYGLVAYSSSLEQIGPLTQNVEDASILLDIISGFSANDSTSRNLPSTDTFRNLNPNKKFKIAILKNCIESASNEIKNLYYESIKILEKLGHEIIEKELLDVNYHLSAYYIIAMAEASSNLSRFDGIRFGNRAISQNLKETYFNTRTLFGDEVKRRILLGTFVLSTGYYEAYYIKAQKIRNLIKTQYNEVFKSCDIIFAPITPSVAPKFGEIKTPLDMYLGDTYSVGVNLAGLPAISIPIRLSPMPIGMQFIGSYLREQDILDVAFGLEKELCLV